MKSIISIFLILFTSSYFMFPMSSYADYSIQDKNSKNIINERDSLANNLINSGVLFWKQRKYVDALKNLNKALDLAIEINDSELEARSLHNIGLVKYSEGKYLECLDYYHKSYEQYKIIGDDVKIAQRLLNIGIVYKKQGLYDKATNYLLEAAQLFENNECDKELSSCFNSIAGIQNRLQNYNEALIYHNKALRIRTNIDYEKGVAGSFNNIGIVYNNMDSLEMAMKYYIKSLKIKQKLNDKKLISSTLLNIGKLNYKMTNYAKAEQDYLQAFTLKKTLYDLNGEMHVTNALGELYFTLKKYKKAEEYLLSGLQLAIQENNINGKLESYKHLKDLYYNIDEFNKSFNYYNDYITLNDTILGLEKAKLVSNLKIKYETEKKEQEIASLNEIKKVQSILIETKSDTVKILLLSVALLLILSVIAYIGYKQKKKANMKIKTLMQERKHRTKNNIQIISSVLSLQSLETESNKVQSAVKSGENRIKSVALIENLLNQNDKSVEIFMPDYFKKLIDYLLTTYGFKNKIDLTMNIENLKLDTDVATPLGLIVNELVTNSLKYAFTDHPNPKLTIELCYEDGKNSILKITDNGIGYDHENNKTNTLGLKLVKILTKQLNGDLEITNLDGVGYQLKF